MVSPGFRSDHLLLTVTTASCIHLCLAVWFIYMALAYHIMPEPSWFPNTTSIGISAVKSWLYYPMAGHFLMAVRRAAAHFDSFTSICQLNIAGSTDFSVVEFFLLPYQPHTCRYEPKDFRHSRLDADVSPQRESLRADSHGTAFF